MNNFLKEYLSDSEFEQFMIPAILLIKSMLKKERDTSFKQTSINKKIISKPALNYNELKIRAQNMNPKSDLKPKPYNTLMKGLYQKLPIFNNNEILILDKIWSIKTHIYIHVRYGWKFRPIGFNYDKLSFNNKNTYLRNKSDIHKLLPKSHIENFKDIFISAINFVSNNNRIKYLISSNKIFTDEYSRLISIIYQREGKKVFYIQHGGNYQTNKNQDLTFFESKLCDKWLGWSSSQVESPIGIIKKARKNENAKHVLYVTTTNNRVPLVDIGQPYGKEFLKHMQNQKKFFSFANKETIKKIKVKLENEDRGFDQNKFFENYLKKKQLLRYVNIIKCFKDSQLVICAYPGTTKYESLAMDIPTIFYWDKTSWEWNEKFKSILNKLQECNVYFSCGKKLAQFLNHNLHNIDCWWKTPKTQEAITLFKNEFRWHQSENDQIKELFSFLKKYETCTKN